MAQINAGRVRFVSRGEYNNTSQYFPLDLVNYNGNSYFAKENTTGNLPTDTTKWQLIAEKGNIGPTGPTGATGNGIASITKTGTSGLVDTYTITYTDGTTSTFEVTNGQDGEVTQEELDETNAEVERAKMVYNALPKVTGTGTEVTLNDTAECPMPMSLKPSAASQATSILPDGYTQVDYIESSGTQYIDTGEKATENTTFDITFYESENTNAKIFGSRISVSNGAMALYFNSGDDFVVNYGTQGITYTDDNRFINNIVNLKTEIADNKYRFHLNNNLLTEFTKYTGSFLDQNMYLGSYNNNGTAVTTSGTIRIYRCKIYNNNLVKNFIPCYRNSDNEVGMYDLVNNTFYTNSGTGSFTYGAVATLPNPDYPIDIHTVSGDNTITIEGKNLFDKDNSTILNAYVSTEAISGQDNQARLVIIPVKPNTTYTISKSNRGFDGSHQWQERIAEFSSVPTYSTPFIVRYNNVGMSYTFTTGSATNYIAYGVAYGTTYIPNLQIYLDTIQLEKGTTATSYLPYTEQTLPLNLPVENLFDKNSFTYDNYYYNDNGELIEGSNTGRCTNYYKVNPNSNYYISGFSTVGSDNDYSTIQRMYYFDSSKNFISRSATFNGKTKYGFITPVNCYYVSFQCVTRTSSTILKTVLADLDTIQLEKGTKVSAYTPYGTTPIELCKIGNYEDYFYKDSDKWYLHKETEKVVLNGSESYTYDSTYTRFYTQLSFSYNTSARSQFPCNLYTNGDSTTNGHFGTNAGGKLLYFFTPSSNITTATDFKNWISNNNLIIYVVLATPTNTEITDTTLISQLEAIYNKATSYQDQTNITQVNNDLPFVIPATGIRDLSNIFELIGGGE